MLSLIKGKVCLLVVFYLLVFTFENDTSYIQKYVDTFFLPPQGTSRENKEIIIIKLN